MLLKNRRHGAARAASLMTAAVIFASFPAPISAAGTRSDISPALSVLAEELSLSKSGLVGNRIEFSESDFDGILGVKVPSVTFISLPEGSRGKLMSGEREIAVGETVYRSELSELQFVPSDKEVQNTTFEIGIVGNQAYSCPCSLYMLSELNFAPTSDEGALSSTDITAFSGVTYYGSMHATDPEGDVLTYTVTEYPSRGTLTASSDGSYSYTPYESHSGQDSFTFVSRDRYGNSTPPTEISVTVKEAKESIVFADMAENEAYGAAMILADAGIMSGRERDGSYYFDPAATVSRADYLSMLYAAAGVTPSKGGDEKVFFDTDDLSTDMLACISDAYENGYIKGETTKLGTYFRPSDLITRSDAAQMTAALLGLDLNAASQTPAFSDSDMISPEAYDSIAAVCSAGIFRTFGGEFAPNAALTRAHAAQVLESVMRYCN